MLYLVLSILCSSLIFVLFKLYDVYKVQTLYAIIVNYIIAFFTGLLLYESAFSIEDALGHSWFFGAMVLGVFFILIFNIMAKTSQVSGVSVASVATKMSLVVPVVFGVMLYEERLSGLQMLGIVLALAAVYLASIKKHTHFLSKRTLILPFLLFLGSGIIDTSMKYFEEVHLNPDEVFIFPSIIFGAAAVTGLVFVALKGTKNLLRLNFRNMIGGILLGIPNYFSIFYLIKALQNEKLTSASIFTVNNVAIVMLSTLLGVLLFKEQMGLKNWAGIVLAGASIVLVILF